MYRTSDSSVVPWPASKGPGPPNPDWSEAHRSEFTILDRQDEPDVAVPYMRGQSNRRAILPITSVLLAYELWSSV